MPSARGLAVQRHVIRPSPGSFVGLKPNVRIPESPEGLLASVDGCATLGDAVACASGECERIERIERIERVDRTFGSLGGGALLHEAVSAHVLGEEDVLADREGEPMNLDEAILRARTLLSAHAGWSMASEVAEDGRVELSLTHPLSPGLCYTVEPSVQAQVEFVATELTRHREIVRCAGGPVAPHAPLVRSLRTVIDTHRWTAAEVRALAITLYTHGCLTDDEVGWLAGYAAQDSPMKSDPP